MIHYFLTPPNMTTYILFYLFGLFVAVAAYVIRAPQFTLRSFLWVLCWPLWLPVVILFTLTADLSRWLWRKLVR